jgi:hypothetical protein
VADAIRASRLLHEDALHTVGRLPIGAAAILAPRPDGRCPAFERTGGNLCAIHRELGHEGLPASCRHFPRVALLEPDAVRVTLSHFCPTAAGMLFREDAEGLAIVHDAAGIADRHDHDGFDARQTIPPLLRPGVAMDPATCRIWEQTLLETFDRRHVAPEDMLGTIARIAETIRSWTAGADSLETHAGNARAAAALERAPARWRMALPHASRLFLCAAESVPRGLVAPAMPADAEAADLAWVQPRWAAFSRPLGRLLAARGFAAWSAYLGEGLRTQVAMLAVALATVRIEAIRETSTASRPLDAARLLAAIRSADLLLHHLSDMPGLVGSFADVEQGPASAFLAAIGLEASR